MNPDTQTNQQISQPMGMNQSSSTASSFSPSMPQSPATPVNPTAPTSAPNNPFVNMMKTVQSAPNSDYSNAVLDKIRSGEFNDLAKQYGYDLTPFNTKPATPPAPQLSPQDQIGANYKSGKINAGDVVVQGLGQAAGEANKALTNPAYGLNPIGDVAAGIGGLASLLGKALSAITDPTAKAIGEGLRNAVGSKNADAIKNQLTAALNHPIVQQAIKTYTSPQVTGDIGAVGNVANLAGTMAMTKAGVEALPELKSAIGAKIGPYLTDKYVKSSIADWQKPADTPKASYSKASDILDNASKKGVNIPETLVKNGVKLSDNVDGGRYNTADTADQIRTDAGKLSSALLRPALEKADASVPLTPVQDVIDATIKDIQNTKGETPGNIEAQVSKAESEGEALARKYPNGMKLSEMHDSKISYSSNGKYSPVGDPATNNIAATNRAFGRALANMVETKAPPEIPVADFNSELSKQYQAADYLDSLQNKPVPRSILQSIAKTTAKVVGAGIGVRTVGALGGGGAAGELLGGVGGYHLGGMLENLVDGMSNPVKNYFLNNLQTENPAAFESVQNYLKSETSTTPPPKAEGATPKTMNTTVEKPVAAIPSELQPLAEEAQKGLSEWKADSFWGKAIKSDATVKNVLITDIGEGKTIGIRQSATTDKGVQEWVQKIQAGERPTVLVGNRPSGAREVTVLDGNHRLQAYKQLGFKEVPIVDNTGGKLNIGANSLIAEAQKYKSAEEFVKAVNQGKVLHGSKETFTEFKNPGENWATFTSKPGEGITANAIGKYHGQLYEALPTGEIKTFDPSYLNRPDVKKVFEKVARKNGLNYNPLGYGEKDIGFAHTPGRLQSDIILEGKKLGYNHFIFREANGEVSHAFTDPKTLTIIPKGTNLTDFYNKATKK